MHSECVDVWLSVGDAPDGFATRQAITSTHIIVSSDPGWLHAPEGLKSFLLWRRFRYLSGEETLDGSFGNDGALIYLGVGLDLEDVAAKQMCVSTSLKECAACLYDSASETTQLEQLIKIPRPPDEQDAQVQPRDCRRRWSRRFPDRRISHVLGEVVLRWSSEKGKHCDVMTSIVGIELEWDKGTYEFCHNTNLGSASFLLGNAMRALNSVVCPFARLRRFERIFFDTRKCIAILRPMACRGSSVAKSNAFSARIRATAAPTSN